MFTFFELSFITKDPEIVTLLFNLPGIDVNCVGSKGIFF